MWKHQNILSFQPEKQTVILLYYHSCRTQWLFSYHLNCEMTEAIRTSSYRYPSDCSLRLEKINLIPALNAVSAFLFSLALHQNVQKQKKKNNLRRKKPSLKFWSFHCNILLKKMGAFRISLSSFMPWLVTNSFVQGNHVLISKYFKSKKKRFHWNCINCQVEMVCNMGWMTAFITC